MRFILNLLLIISFTSIVNTGNAEKIELTVAELKAGGQPYFFALLEESLTADGHHVTINNIGRLPQKRMAKMLDDGELSLLLLVESKERNKNTRRLRLV